MKQMIRIFLMLFVCSIITVQAQSVDEETVSVRLVMKTDTGGTAQLTLLENGELIELASDFALPVSEGFFVDWSPDCNRIAFTADAPPETVDNNEFGIFVYDFATNVYSRLVSADIAYPITPSWSPTGETVYFMRFTENARLSYIINVESGDYQEFQLPEISFSNVSWAGDGNSLAIVTFGAGQNSLYMVDLKSGVPMWTSVFVDETVIFQQILSANGNEIIFIHGEFGVSDVYTLNLITGEISLLTLESAQRGTLALSPNEGMIAYNEGSAVYVMNSDGTGIHEITDATMPDFGQSRILGWTQDGDYVVIQVIMESRNLVHDVYAIAVDGSTSIRLTETPIVEQAYNNWYACFPQEG